MINSGWVKTVGRDENADRVGYARVVYVRMPTRKGDPPSFSETFLSVFPGSRLELRLQTGRRVTTLQGLRECEVEGSVVLFPPPRAEVLRTPLFTAEVRQAAPSEQGDLVKETEDVLEQLGGQPSRLDRVRQRVEALLAAPQPEQHVAAVRVAYDALPRYARGFAGNMDSKDAPLRQVLGASSQPELVSAVQRLRDEWGR